MKKKLFMMAFAVNIFALMLIIGIGASGAIPNEKTLKSHASIEAENSISQEITIIPNDAKTRENKCRIKDGLQAIAVREVNRLHDEKAQLGCSEINYDNFKALRISHVKPESEGMVRGFPAIKK